MSQQTTTAAIEAGVRTWTLDPAHTQVEFAVRHMVFATVKGRFPIHGGTIQFDETDLSRSRVEVDIDVSGIATGDARRDGHLRSGDFFDVENHPRAAFISRRVDPIGPNGARIHGDLTIRGVTKSVILDATLTGRGTSPWGASVIGFSATATIARADWGLTWNVGLEAGGVLVGDSVTLQIDAQATPAA